MRHKCHYYVGSLVRLVSLQAGTGQTCISPLAAFPILPAFPRELAAHPLASPNAAHATACAPAASVGGRAQQGGSLGGGRAGVGAQVGGVGGAGRAAVLLVGAAAV